VDIFKGGWSSRFPAELAVEAGASALFEDPRLQRLIDIVGGIEDYRILELGPLVGRSQLHDGESRGAVSAGD
jgi:hypothetical protein